MRSFSFALPCSRSIVHLTSATVNGLPSCHLTPLCSGKVSSVPSSLQLQLVASSGTIESGRVLRLVLLEDDEIVEYARHRPVDRLRRLLEHRHARRAGEMTDFESASGFLCQRRVCAPTQATACPPMRARGDLASFPTSSVPILRARSAHRPHSCRPVLAGSAANCGARRLPSIDRERVVERKRPRLGPKCLVC